MQKQRLWLAVIFMITFLPTLKAQHEKQDSCYRKWFVGSTFLMLGNFIPNDQNPPQFVQLNFGYRISPKNAVSLEFKRSIYAWPLGIPWGPSFDAPGLNYPGHARILAPTLAYQHFWFKGLYTSIHALNAFEKYLDESHKKIGNGYTLYLTGRLGYQLKFFKNRCFFEPSVGMTYWPIRTKVPTAFQHVEAAWPNYFGWEPGLHFGFNF